MTLQEIGETVNEILLDDEKEVNRIINENKDRREPYWILIFAKPAKVLVDGFPAMMRYRKAVFQRPQSQVGLIICEVNNATGTLRWEVNMPDRPINFEAMGLEADGGFQVKSNIASAYVYN